MRRSLQSPSTSAPLAHSSPLQLAAVTGLRGCANQFGRASAAQKLSLLRKCSTGAVIDADVLLAYHDCLLFLLAYPESAQLHAITRRELARVATAARAIVQGGNARMRAKLANSGVAWAPMTIAFGYDIARWLAIRHPRHAEVDSFDAAGASLANVLRHALPPLEFELLATGEHDSQDFLAQASEGHRGSRLTWLVAQIARLPCGEELQELLFDSLHAFITISPAATPLSRTFVRGPATKIFFHRDGLRRVDDSRDLLAAPFAQIRPLSLAERQHLLDAGRAMLASLGRETDAIAAASPGGIEFHVLDRGVTIALYTMVPGRRLPLDSHVGFMLFKNSVPVGYGGAWPFLGTAKIGVNIFTPYRGGESAYLFCQVLRVYAQRFGVDHFVAEPSQFGGGNKEGLESGAFWFYYRLGFRPVESKISALAAHEFERMRVAPRYRSPLAILRRFTRSDIELKYALAPANAAREALPACDPADLSLAVSSWIATRFHGNRDRAMRSAVRKVSLALGTRGAARWPPSERAAFESFCLLLALIPDLAQWPARDKARAIALARAKGGNEFRYFDLLRKHLRLQSALRAVSAPGA
ncbi:MAG: hypothetical protein ABI607_02430 [Betaproteobacteria bacterium]